MYNFAHILLNTLGAKSSRGQGDMGWNLEGQAGIYSHLAPCTNTTHTYKTPFYLLLIICLLFYLIGLRRDWNGCWLLAAGCSLDRLVSFLLGRDWEVALSPFECKLEKGICQIYYYYTYVTFAWLGLSLCCCYFVKGMSEGREYGMVGPKMEGIRSARELGTGVSRLHVTW